MVKWLEICKPKDQASLGITSSKRMSITLLSEWLWRISTEEGGLLLDIISAKNCGANHSHLLCVPEDPNSSGHLSNYFKCFRQARLLM